MKELLSIKEFSKLSGTEQTTLRYWDEIGLFSPAERNPANNYRYYTPEQIAMVSFITVLSSLNVPLKTICAMQGARTPASIIDLIEHQERLLDMEMRRLRECYSIIHARLELVKYGIRLESGYKAIGGVRQESGREAPGGIDVDESRVCALQREDKTLILGPSNEFKETETFYELFMRFCRKAKELRINLNYPIGGYHENMESFVKAPGLPDRFFSIDPTGNSVRPAGEYIVGFSRGYYGEFDDLPGRIAAFAQENALTISGPVYTIYLHDEICTKDSSQYLVQVCVAASK